jgi:hypothetical protein
MSCDKHSLIKKLFKLKDEDDIYLKDILESEKIAGQKYLSELIDNEVPEILPYILNMPSSKDAAEILGLARLYELLGGDLKLLYSYVENHPPKSSKEKVRIGPVIRKKILQAVEYSKRKRLISGNSLYKEILEKIADY